MSAPTLLEAHKRFAAVLDELRRKYVTEFDQWLKNALAGDLDTTQHEARERIATAPRKFSDEFLDQHAPGIVGQLNREAEYDILKALRTYDARPEPLARRLPLADDLQWGASLWRTVLAAAFGAVAAIILLAMQLPAGDPLPAQPPSVGQPGQPGQPPVAPPAEPTPNPTAQAQAPAPPTSPPPTVFIFVRQTVVLWLLAAAFTAGLGAAIGVFIVASPTLPALLQRIGLSGTPLLLARRLSATFAIMRAGPLIMLLAALLTGLFGLIAWLLGGSKPLHVAVGLTAVGVILAARWTAPDGIGPDREALHRDLVAQFDRELAAEAKVWAALSAALVLKRHDGGKPTSVDAREITNIILARREESEPAETILQVIEHQLGLPSGPRKSAGQQDRGPSEFVWKSEHGQDYTTFGVVEVGDLVTVSSRPLYIEDGSGGKRVSQKGVVTRKR